MDTVEHTLKASGLFEALNEDEFQSVASTATTLQLPSNTMIAHEGEVGQECYVIFHGAVQVLTTAADGQEVVVAKCEAGDFIGEQALLPDSKGRRNASLRAHSDVTLLRITKTDFQRILAHDHPLKDRLLQRGKEQVQHNLLRQSALFRSLYFGADTVWYREEGMADREVVFRQGDPGDKAYVVLSGAADVYEEEADGSPRLLRQLGPGSVFGELALLEQQPRSATVLAHGPLKVLSIDGNRFLTLYQRRPEVREYMHTLKNIYPLAGRGFMTQYLGTFLGMECLTTVASLIDGTTAVSSLVIGHEIFHMSVTLHEAEALEILYFEDPSQDIERKLVLSRTTIIEVTSHGHWPELGHVYRMVLERTPLASEQIALFRQEGILAREVMLPLYQDHETVCHCMQVTRGDIRLAIEGGGHTADAVMESAGTGTVCGSCRVLLHEMVGQVDWTPVHISKVLAVAEGIRTFRLTPHRGALKPAKPGQHILLQAYIEGTWVQRPYTISSAAHETRYRDITVKREPHGLFSGWLFEERWEGTLIRISDPQGDFCLEPADAEEPIVCLVGGISMTPALAMCRSMAHDSTLQPLHIDYSASTREQLAYADELQQAAATYDHIDLNLRTTADNGRLTASDIAQLEQQYPKAQYYVCGPSAYQQAVETYLKDTAVGPDRIHTEAFTPVGDQPVAPTRHYFYLGAALLLAFALQEILPLKWPWLETLQERERFKRWSGLLLTLYIGSQFILPFLRQRGYLRAAARHYHLHKLQGAFAPLFFYAHSTSLGYAYLLGLSLVYFANVALGLLNHERVTQPRPTQRYRFYWLIAHIGLSLLIVALVAYHIYVVFAYQ